MISLLLDLRQVDVWTMHQVPKSIHTPSKCAIKWALELLGAPGLCSVPPGETPILPTLSWGSCGQALCPLTMQQLPMGASLGALLQDRVCAATEASHCGKIKQNQGLVLIRDLFFFLSVFGIICNILAYRHPLRMKVWPLNWTCAKEPLKWNCQHILNIIIKIRSSNLYARAQHPLRHVIFLL